MEINTCLTFTVVISNFSTIKQPWKYGLVACFATLHFLQPGNTGKGKVINC